MDDKEIQKRIKEGYILCQISFEVLGSPKDHVEKTIKGFINNIRKDDYIRILSEEYGEAEEQEGGLFSAFVDTEMLVKGLEKFNWLCVNFMPSSIEIIAPAELKFKDVEITSSYNDLLAKLHEITMSYRALSTKESMFIKNMNAMIQNAIIIACEHTHDPVQIGKKLGIPGAQLDPFLEALEKKGKISKKNGSYYVGGSDGTKKGA